MERDPRQVFEACMRAKSYTNFDRLPNGQYVVSGLNIRWNYFRLGWEMRGLS